MSTAMAFLNCETQNKSAEDMLITQSHGRFKAIGNRPMQSADTQRHGKFKKRLLDCETGGLCEQLWFYLNQKGFSSENLSDNSMCQDSNTACDTKEFIAGVVGILEGFGLLEYQSGIECNLPENVSKFIEYLNNLNAFSANNDISALDEQVNSGIKRNELLQGLMNYLNRENQLPEDFAGMLQNERLMALPKQMKEAVLKLANEYLSSFESTNNDLPLPDAKDLSILLLKMKTVLKEDKTVDESKKPGMKGGVENHHAVNGKTSIDPGQTQKAERAATKGAQDDAALQFRDNVIRIVDKISTQALKGRREFDVELKPDFLGKLNIKLTMENGVIKTQIKTQNMAVKGLISEEIPELYNMLREKGIDVSNIDVMYENQAFLNDRHHAFGGNRNGSGKRDWQSKAPADPATGSVLYDAVMDLPFLYFSNSSVEFHA